MFSRILTFSVLSVFCVLTAISAVYAHTPTNPVYDSDMYHEHGDSGWHYHRNVLHWERGLWGGRWTRLHEHTKPGFVHNHSNGVEYGKAIDGKIFPADENFNIIEPPNLHDDPTKTGYEDAPDPRDEIQENSRRGARGVPEQRPPTSQGDPPPPVSQGDPPSSFVIDLSDPEEDLPNQGTERGSPNPIGDPPGTERETPLSSRGDLESREEVILIVEGDRIPPVIGTRGTPQGTSSPQPTAPVTAGTTPQPTTPVTAGTAPQQTRPASPPIHRLYVTEYMVRDWSKGGAFIGESNLPQWIELYNPNAEAVNLKGWTFQYATRRFRNQPYKVHTLTLAATEDGFSIPGGGVALLATQRLPARKFSGIETTQVYNLNIENVLKRGWVLTDADGKEIQRIGREAFSALGDPVAPPHQDGARVSHHAYRSESPSEPYYYGDSGDIGSPGFYEQPPPAAPSKVKRKRIGTWASLKK